MKIERIELSKIFSEKEMEEIFEALNEKFCSCGYVEDMAAQTRFPPEYVENYLGENHGWICPHCRKFIQIG